MIQLRDLRIGDWFGHDGDYYLVVCLTEGVTRQILKYTAQGMYRGHQVMGAGIQVKYLGSNIIEVFKKEEVCSST